MNNGIFEGGFRRLPEQNLAGASKHSRKGDFLEKIQWERLNRQLEVKRKWGATVIQSLVRGFLVRRRWRNVLVNELNIISHARPPISYEKFGYYMGTYCYFEGLEAPHVLEWLNNMVMTNQKSIISEIFYEDSLWLWRMKWFLKANAKKIGYYMDNGSAMDPISILSHLEVLETFTCYETFSTEMGDHWALITLKAIINYLLANKFFFVLRNMLYTDNHLAIGFTQKSELRDLVNEHLTNIVGLVGLGDAVTADYVPLVREFAKHFLTNRTTKDAKPIIMNIALNLKLEGTNAFVNGIINGEIAPSTMCFYAIVECFKRGYFFVPKGLLLGRTLEALAVLLKNGATYCPPVKNRRCFDDEPMASDSNDIDDDSSDDDDDGPSTSTRNHLSPLNQEMLNESLSYVKSIEFAVSVVDYLTTGYPVDILSHLSKFVHVLVAQHPFSQFKILWYLPLHPRLYKDLWVYLYSLQRREGSRSKSLLLVATEGKTLTAYEAGLFYPALITFCTIFKRHLCLCNYDGSTPTNGKKLPFNKSRLVELSTRLRDLAYTILKTGTPDKSMMLMTDIEEYNYKLMEDAYRPLINVLRLLHSREFVPDMSYWIKQSMFDFPGMPPFTDSTLLSRHELFKDPTMLDRLITSTNNATRPFMVLRDLPFTVPTQRRLVLLQELFNVLKAHFQSPQDFVNENTFIKIRRDYIYEDAFEKLSDFEMPDIRVHIRVQLISSIGYEEVGVDGGGIFREFMTDFLKAAFDPNRGFFMVNQQNMLYPNPNAEVLYINFRRHYFFIGRMLAKALFEGISFDLPLADFFLASIIKRDRDVNLYNLHSLDPMLHKNLTSLLKYEGDVTALGLNYTCVNDLYGHTTVTELIKNGEKECVNKNNRIDYIQIVSDYKLNIQAEAQCNYFKQGIGSVFSLYWLAMFSAKELQRSVFCSDSPINVDDLRSHSYYSGGYTCSHPNILRFWRVFTKFDNDEKKLLLKFVTSCPRQPLLGFKDLDPPFTIQLVENSDRLPTSSTCMNLLKLPLFRDEAVMKEKLLISINSQAGFDLC